MVLKNLKNCLVCEFGVRKNPTGLVSKWCQKIPHSETWPRTQGSANDLFGWLQAVLNSPPYLAWVLREGEVCVRSRATEATEKEHQGGRTKPRRVRCHRKLERTVGRTERSIAETAEMFSGGGLKINMRIQDHGDPQCS